METTEVSWAGQDGVGYPSEERRMRRRRPKINTWKLAPIGFY